MLVIGNGMEAKGDYLDELVACLFSCWCSTSRAVSSVSGENEAGKFVMTIQDMRVDTVTALSELLIDSAADLP